MKALANRRRLAIVKLLESKGPLSVGAIAQEITLSFKATSAHLLLLYKAEFVEREQTSTTVLYSLIKPFPPTLRVVLNIL